MTTELAIDKSEILFLYESTYSIPNGDPFTGEQRYDDETKKVLVSDVRIKRFIRDFMIDNGIDVFVRNDRTNVKEKVKASDAESGAAARFNTLEAANPKGITAHDILTSMIDVRLFGGISTKAGSAVNLTGPVQFALLNPSLNSVELRMHQNTSVFASSTDKSRGSIGTTTVVPYALNQIHGWINPFSAKQTNLAIKDIQRMFTALWYSINSANTRTKSNQASLVLLNIIYSMPTKKLYGLDRSIHLNPISNKREEQIRSRADYELDFSSLIALAARDEVKRIEYYTEDEALKQSFQNKKKFELLSLSAL